LRHLWTRMIVRARPTLRIAKRRRILLYRLKGRDKRVDARLAYTSRPNYNIYVTTRRWQRLYIYQVSLKNKTESSLEPRLINSLLFLETVNQTAGSNLYVEGYWAKICGWWPCNFCKFAIFRKKAKLDQDISTILSSLLSIYIAYISQFGVAYFIFENYVFTIVPEIKFKVKFSFAGLVLLHFLLFTEFSRLKIGLFLQIVMIICWQYFGHHYLFVFISKKV